MKNLSVGRLFIYIVLSLIIFQYISLLIKNKPENSDFRSFYSAVRILVEQPEQIYNRELQFKNQSRFYNKPGSANFEFLPYLNPPFYLIPFVPFHLINNQLAYRGLMIIILVVMAANLILLNRLFKSKSDYFLKILLTFSFAPLFLTLLQTQNSFISLLIYISVFYYLKEKKYFPAGIISSLLLFKPQLFAVLLIYSLFVKNKKLILGILTGALALFILSSLIIKGNWNSYFSMLSWYAGNHEISTFENIYVVSLYGFFNQLHSHIPRFSPLLLSILTGLFILFLSMPKLNNIKSGSVHMSKLFSLIIVTTLLIGIHVNVHDTVLLMFPFYVYWQQSKSLKFYLLCASGWIIMFLAYFSPFFPKPLYFLPALYLLYIFWLILKDINSTSPNTSENNHIYI